MTYRGRPAGPSKGTRRPPAAPLARATSGARTLGQPGALLPCDLGVLAGPLHARQAGAGALQLHWIHRAPRAPDDGAVAPLAKPLAAGVAVAVLDVATNGAPLAGASAELVGPTAAQLRLHVPEVAAGELRLLGRDVAELIRRTHRLERAVSGVIGPALPQRLVVGVVFGGVEVVGGRGARSAGRGAPHSPDDRADDHSDRTKHPSGQSSGRPSNRPSGGRGGSARRLDRVLLVFGERLLVGAFYRDVARRPSRRVTGADAPALVAVPRILHAPPP